MPHILSLGAGVQSSTLAMMAAVGVITPMPLCAVFADTESEPKQVYVWLDWLERQLPFPVYRVSAGDLAETSTRIRVSGRSGQPYLSHAVPAFTKNLDGSKGNYFRQCTDKHKLTPLRKKIDELRGDEVATVWIGISTDEAARMKPSRNNGIINRWPLIESGISRIDCLEWMKERNCPPPPRSACVFCPYHNNTEWRRMLKEDPEGFVQAVAYEKRLQAAAEKIPGLTGIPYLHVDRIPLETVDFRTAEQAGQNVLFDDECEGMCGV